MAGRNPNPGGFDTSEKVNSNTLKRHPKMDLSRTDLLQLLSYLEGELQARDVVIATLKAEKAKQLLYQAKYGRFGLGDPFSAMQRDSDNMKDDTFDESAIKSMYDNQLAQLENLIATQRKAQLKMREQMLGIEKKYQKVCSELDDEKRKHAQDTAQGDDVTYMLEKERERLNKEVDFEKANTKKMEKDLKKTLASLEDERANSVKHKQVALMLIKERRKLVEKLLQEKQKADEVEKLLVEEKSKSNNMAEGLVQESKKSLKMEATMERQASEFDLEREQLRNKLLREENRNKELQAHIESLIWQLENVHNAKPVLKDSVHTVEIKSNISAPPLRLSSERTWTSSPQTIHASKPVGNIVEREAGFTPRSAGDVNVRKHDNVRYASPQAISVERGNVQYGDSSYETRVGPIGAVADSKHVLDHHKPLNVSVTGPTVVSSGSRIMVQTNNPSVSQGPVSPRRTLTITRGTPPPVPPNKPSFPVTTTIPAQKSSTTASTSLRKEDRLSGSKPVHIPVSVVHTSTVSASPSQRTPSHEGSPSTLRKPAQFRDDSFDSFTSDLHADLPLPPPTSESFDFLDPEMADLQQLLVSMVSVPSNTPGVDSRVAVEGMLSSCSPCSGSIEMSPSNVPISVTSLVVTSSNTSVNMTSSVTSFDDHSMTCSSNGTPQGLLDIGNKAANEIISPGPVATPLISPRKSAWMEASRMEAEQSARSTQIVTSMASVSTSSTSLPIFAVMTSAKMSTVVSPINTMNMSPLTSSLMSSVISSPASAVSSNAIGVNMSPMTSPMISQQKTLVTSNISIRTATSNSEPQQKLSTMIVLPETLPVEIYSKDINTTSAINVVTRVSAQMAVRNSYENSQLYANSVHSRTPEQRMQERFVPASPIHRYAATGVVDALRKLIFDLEADVNLPMKDGTTPAHCAAENGQEDCLQLLLDKGCHVNSLRDDQQTPVHCSASFGHIGCLRLLLDKRGNSNLADQYGWSPLHWAANNGHLEACRLLLSYGARRLVYSNNMWTPLHLAVQSDWSEILELLLTFESTQSEKASHVQSAIAQTVDKDGQTLSHIAACKQSQKCLSVILAYCDIDYDVCDRWGRTVLDISSPNCMHVLDYYANSRTLNLTVEVQCSGPAYSHADPYLIGRLLVHPKMHWGQLDTTVSRCFGEYLGQLDKGLSTKKTIRLDPEGSGSEGSQFTLGLTADSIDGYSIGNVFWRRSEPYPAVKLQDILFDQQEVTVAVILKGSTCDLDSLAFDLLLPKPFIESYIRLLEQYKCVVFYGPEGTRKKQLVKRLSRYLAEKERQRCGESRLSQVYLHRDFKHRDFESLLKTEGCLLPADSETCRCNLLVLFHLEKVNLDQMLGSFTERIDNRGSKHTFSVQASDGVHEFYYFPENFYLIATMDKPRSTGLDLNLQQRFRWVHFRISNEPIKNLLGRHMLRRLLHTYGGEIPSPEESLFKVVEWVLCVWQRVNHGANKLGLVDVVLGPDIFLPCPLESKSSIVILDWLKRLWNETVAPAVHEAILKGAGKDSTVEGQQKVTNTALYVLMQRAIVPGCPLNGQEKEDFLRELSGSNELNVPLKTEKINFSAAMAMSLKQNLHNGNHRNSENQVSAAQNRNSSGTPINISSNNPSASSQNYHNNSMPKRRSYSDQPTNQNGDIEIPVIHDPVGAATGDIQAKIPKLEIRSPLLGLPISLPNTFSSGDRFSLSRSSLNSKTGGSSLSANASNSLINASFSQRRSTFSTTQSRIPQLSSAASAYKRSRSSENLSLTDQLSNRQDQKEATSPFSFSLTTPNTSLFSFKMFDKGNERKPSKSRSQSSSPTSLLYPRSLNRR